MSVLLVNLNYKELIYKNKNHPHIIPPLGLAYLASALENHGIEVEILESNANNLTQAETVEEIISSKAKYIGLTGTAETMPLVKYVCERVKQKSEKKIILGGPYASFVPDKILSESQYIDIIVRGEGEYILPKLIEKLEKDDSDLFDINGISWKNNNRIIRNPDEQIIKNIDEILFPAYHLLPMDKYTPNPFFYRKRKNEHSFAIITSRGCPMRCYYCSASSFWRIFRMRSIDNIFQELKILILKYKVSYIDIWDDLFTVSIERVKKFCIMLKENNFNIKFSVYARIESLTNEMITTLNKSGCVGIQIGIESGNRQILRSINKDVKIDTIIERIAKIHNTGMKSISFFMIGLPGETEKTVRDSIKLAKVLKTDYILFNTVVPYPGTYLYEMSLKNGIIDDRYPWDKMSKYFEKLYHTQFLSSEEIRSLYNKSYISVYFRPGYIFKHFFSLIFAPLLWRIYFNFVKELIGRLSVHIDDNKQYYINRINKSGDDFRAGGYWTKTQFNSRVKMLSHLLNSSDNKRILDVGCGCGFLTQKLTEKNQVVGVDHIFQFLRYASKKGLIPVQGDAVCLPFKDNSFDMVIAIGVSQESPNMDVFISELIRVVKQSGYIIFSYLTEHFFIRKIIKLFQQKEPHIKSYSIKEIEILLKKYNISVTSCIYNLYPIPIVIKKEKYHKIMEYFASSVGYKITKR